MPLWYAFRPHITRLRPVTSHAGTKATRLVAASLQGIWFDGRRELAYSQDISTELAGLPPPPPKGSCLNAPLSAPTLIILLHSLRRLRKYSGGRGSSVNALLGES
jgi:hypothetical protein